MNHPIGHEAIVYGCSDCPLCGQGYPSGMFCQHPEDISKGPIEEDKKGDLITPEYCPLKFEPITIIMKENVSSKNNQEKVS